MEVSIKGCAQGARPDLMDQPFRFLDLPKELRLMVYEFLPVTTRHYTLRTHFNEKPSDFKLVKKVLPSVTILATCRIIQAEAAPILARKLHYISLQPMQYIVDAECSNLFLSPWRGLLTMILQKANDPIMYEDFIRGFGWPWPQTFILKSAPFISECVEWQRKKRSTGPSVLEEMRIAFRLAPPYRDLDDENLDHLIYTLLHDSDVLYERYFTTMSLNRPCIFAKLCGQEEAVWNKWVNEYTGPNEEWRNWSLPTLSDQTWSEEWDEGESLP